MDIVTLAAAKSYTNSQIAGVTQFDYQVVETLPTVGTKGVIYLVPQEDERHKEYIYIGNEFEELGYVDPYILPTASSEMLGGVKIGSGLSIDTNGVASAKPDYVHQCTGTADDTAIAALLDAFFATDKTSYRLDIIGDFGGTGTLTITQSTDKGQSVYLNFAGCNVGSSLETVTINIAGETSVHISNLKSYESFIFVLSGTGTKFFSNCEIQCDRTFANTLFTNNTDSKLYISDCRIGHGTLITSNPTIEFLKNYGKAYISNTFFSGKYSNESGKMYLVNCDNYIVSIYGACHNTNKAYLYAVNSRLYGQWVSTSSARWNLVNCDLYLSENKGLNIPATEVIMIGCNFTSGGQGAGVNNTFNVTKLIIDNCEIAYRTRIVCNSASAIVKITNNVFKSARLDYSNNWNGGGLKLGTDNSTIPKFHISGNTFETSGVVIGGNEVAYITADNEHYMPEFSNEFAIITVTFNANGGTVSPATKGVILGHTYGDLPTPTKADSTFVEWNTASDGTGDTVTSSTMVNSSTEHTLYAIWTEAT